MYHVACTLYSLNFIERHWFQTKAGLLFHIIIWVDLDHTTAATSSQTRSRWRKFTFASQLKHRRWQHIASTSAQLSPVWCVQCTVHVCVCSSSPLCGCVYNPDPKSVLSGGGRLMSLSTGFSSFASSLQTPWTSPSRLKTSILWCPHIFEKLIFKILSTNYCVFCIAHCQVNWKKPTRNSEINWSGQSPPLVPT